LCYSSWEPLLGDLWGTSEDPLGVRTLGDSPMWSHLVGPHIVGSPLGDLP
jgi:hypothetical protein